MPTGVEWREVIPRKSLVECGVFGLLPAFHTRPSGAPSPRERAFDLCVKLEFYLGKM